MVEEQDLVPLIEQGVGDSVVLGLVGAEAGAAGDVDKIGEVALFVLGVKGGGLEALDCAGEEAECTRV